MQETVLGLFGDYVAAERAMDELRGAGFDESTISALGNAAARGASTGADPSHGNVGEGVFAGALTGAAGLAALAIPGIGPALALGPLAAGMLGAGIGAVAGGVIAELRQLGIPEEDAGCLCEAIRRGGTLVAVSASSDEVERAAAILGSHRLVDLDHCRGSGNESGWQGFDSTAEPAAHAPIKQVQRMPEGLPFDPSSSRRGIRRYVRVR
jgi:hypothetical protein